MLLSTSSRHGKDRGELLLDFFEGIETKSKEVKLKSEVTQLAILRDKLKLRASLLAKEINNQTEELPTSLHQINLSSSVKPAKLGDKDIAGFIDAQKIEAYNYAFGVKISSRSSSKITFDIQNSTDGVACKDVYQVVLRKNNPGFSLDSALLPCPNSLEPKVYNFNSIRNSDQPSVIPLQALADHNLPKVDKFIKEVKKHLSAYSSRYRQVSLLTKHFDKGEVHDIDCNEDFTLIKFALVIGDSQADDLNLHLALRYEHGDKRPVKESLRMKLSGRQKSSLDSDALAEIKNQLTYFYTHSIVDAIQHAFL